MKRLLVLCFLLVGCADREYVSIREGNGVRAVRAAQNQPSLQVQGAEIPGADLVLLEGQGFEVARDRFFQMDILRRMSQGRLAALVGEKALSKDIQAIAAGLPLSVENAVKRIQLDFPSEYLELEAYSKGVNRFLEVLPLEQPEVMRQYAQVTGDLGYQPEKWEPKDSLAIMKNVGFYLSSNLSEKLVLGGMALSFLRESWLGAAKLANLFDLRPLEPTIIVEDPAEIFNPTSKNFLGLKDAKRIAKSKSFEVSCSEMGFPFPECSRKSAFGSNNFVASNRFSGSTKTFLGNDPHLPLYFPSLFYEIALDSVRAGGSIHARGVALPGVPGVLIGHNAKIAWGMTNLGADVDDVYLETINPEGTQYKFKGEWKPISVRVYQVEVKNGPKVVKQPVPLRSTEHGPLIGDFVPELTSLAQSLAKDGNKIGISYKWTGHVGTSEYKALSALSRAGNFDEFRAAVGYMEAGSQNIVYADTLGNIGYLAPGKFPIRKYINGVYPLPYVPVFGEGQYEWSGFRKNVPEMFNPVSGRIVTANNDPWGHSLKKNLSDFQDYFGAGFSSGARAYRIAELLDSKKGNLDLSGVESIQFDHKDIVAAKFISLLEKADFSESNLSGGAKELQSKLMTWSLNGAVASKDLNEPVLVEAWLLAVMDLVFAEVKKLSPTAYETFRMTALATKTAYNKMNDGLSLDATKKQVTQMLAASLEAASASVIKESKESVRWGEINRLSFTNSLEGILPPLVNYPLERDGSFDTVDVAGLSTSKGFGPNFRMVISLEPGKIEATNVIPGGNWNQFQSGGLIKELLRWRNGEHRPMVSFQ